ncbi:MULTISPECIES: hypothetical protein [unclassified Bradyrhizobium]|uniref:hypothetical protein n=1 Tax=unclassified Bradyrhizobium TaxID=2631580 RepID=UPI00247A877F|nr:MULTISPECIES: hypothetical protein [unclassified Bradyrhizobium]WGS21281.1 hypothetical protein MTX22_05955 [Bradyrhizobium sp. ISRA463]WGS28208.1 hypothetical protein MTX19_03800 [Bradyrhizobium sp. ISRA464]
MSSLTKALSSGLAALAVAATLTAGSAPAQARDGRNAALIGGLIVGGLIGGALASEAQAYPSYPSYQGYSEYPTYRRTYSGYDDGYYAPRYRYRNCDDDYRSVSGWDSDDD